MSMYTIDQSRGPRRQAVEKWLFGLDLLSSDVREKTATAWTSIWASSPYERLEDMPFTISIEYRLMDHVNEVTRAGLDLAKRAQADWDIKLDNDILIPILILHDLDKPLLYARSNGKRTYSQLYYELPHGVVGGMLLKELGFPHVVISTVATHATNAPFHGRNVEAFVLHYADYFACDHALMVAGVEPFYQKKLMK